MATWCEELTPWERPWCWERLKAGGEGDDRGWDGQMMSLTRWTWIWVSSNSCNGQGGLAYCNPRGLIELNMTEQLNWIKLIFFYIYLVFCGLGRLTFILIDFWRLVWIFCVSSHINEGKKSFIFPVCMLFISFSWLILHWLYWI